MTNQHKALAVDSFNITGMGIVVYLQHSYQGLPTGTELLCTESGRIWRVKSRLLFDHAEQEVFPNETPAHVHFSFSSIDKLLHSKKAILDGEAQKIYQYILEPVHHADKPRAGQALTIK
jgi:hypothetical protein